MPKKIIAVLLSALVIVTAFALPTFAAEDTEETPFIYSDYPTANLVSYPYDGYTNVQGFYSVQDDFGISINGVATAKHLYYFVLGQSIPAGTYTISLSVAGNATKNIRFEATVITNGVYSYHAVYAVDGELSSCTFTVSEDSTISLYLFSIASDEVLDLQVYPMMNVGEVAYPFSPYMPYVLEQQYNNGYASGEAAGDKVGYDRGFLEGTSAGIIQGTEQGYKDGYQAAVDAFSADNLNPFSVASLVGQVYLPSDPTIVYEMEIHPSLTADGAISVNACIDLIKNRFTTGIYEGNDLTDAQYVLHFSWLNQSASVGAFDCETSLFAYRGTVGVVDPYMLTGNYWGFLNGSEYHPSSGLNSSISAGVFLFDIGTVEGFTLSDFRLRYKDTSANRSADLYIYPVRSIKSPQYNVGYLQGFLEGQKSSLEDAGQIFYDQGYNVGFSDGKKEGLSIAETGDWRNLMLAVTEAPINTFQSLFNFQVLGMDMRAAFGSILALCVVLIIVKKAVGL